MRRKIVSILLVISILAAIFPVSFLEAEAANSGKKAFIGEAKYASETNTKKDYKITYYYTDEYFTKSGYKNDPSLATMSVIVAMAAGRSNTEKYANKSKNIKQLWTDCGFSKISINDDFKKEPTSISTAFGCASKEITANGKKYTLISIAVSGIRSTHEWGGAFYFGESGPYLAGRYVADRIVSYLKQYIKNNKIKGNVKIWLSGFGVAGSAVNLVGADLDKGINLGNDAKYTKENIYAYCFECPNSDLTSNSLAADKYKNIFVYNNPYDYITHFAPERYNIGLYGVVNRFPTAHGDSQYASKRDKMVSYLKKIDGAPAYTLDDFEEKRVSLFGEGHVEPDYSKVYDINEYLTYGVDALAETCAPDRKQYVDEFQDDLCDLFDFVLGSDDLNWYNTVESFGKIVSDNILPVGINMLFGYEDNLRSLFASYAYTAIEQTGTKATDDKVEKFAKTLAKVACKYGARYPDYCITLFSNFRILFQARDATYTLAWLESVDPNYQVKGKNIKFCQAASEKDSYAYTGKAIKPSIIVTNRKTILKSGKDYTISYSKNTAVGNASVTITGKGSYAGKLTTTFSIVPEKVSIKASSMPNGIKLKWGVANGAGGYYIYRKTSSSSDWKEVANINSGTTKEWIDRDVSNNKSYTYSIVAYKDKFKSSKSNSVTCTWNDLQKSDNVIVAKNIEKTVSSNTAVYAINASAKGNAKLTYKSDNKFISVNSKGNISVSRGYIGKAKITITAEETSDYKKASKTITVKILPSAKVETVKTPKKWDNEENVSGIYFEVRSSLGTPDYRIQIATSADFRSNTIVVDKTRKYDTEYAVNGIFIPLESGKNYYTRIMWTKNGVSSGKWTTYSGKVEL